MPGLNQRDDESNNDQANFYTNFEHANESDDLKSEANHIQEINTGRKLIQQLEDELE